MARFTPLLIGSALVGCSDGANSRELHTAAPAPLNPGSEWVAKPDSLGSLAIGTLYSAVARAHNAPTRPIPDDPEERACDYAGLPVLPKGVLLMVFGDTVVRADVDSTGVVTREGLGVGSPESALLSAYKGRVRVEAHPYSGPEWHYVIVTPSNDSTHRMIFETDGKRVRSYRIGLRRAVEQIEGCS